MQRPTFFSRTYAPYLILLILTLVAASLRFYKLGEWSFWGDEVFTLSSKPDGFVTSLSTRLIHAATTLLGVNEWNARLIPALVGVVSIPILFFFVASLFGNCVGLISSALLAVSTWHIYWSQNARFYALLLLFYSLAMLSFYIGIEKNRLFFLLLSLAFLGLAAQERMLALILLPVEICYLLALLILPIDKPPGLNFRNLLIYFAPGVIVAAFIAGPFIRNLRGWVIGFGRVNNDPVWILSGIIYYVGFPTICLAAFGAAYLLVKKERAGLFFGLGAIIPPIVITVVSIFQYTGNRYAFISLISWIVLASLAINELISQQKGETRLLAIGVLVILLGSSLSEDYQYFRYQNGNRENLRAAITFIKEMEAPGDRVLLRETDVGNYYLAHKTFPLDKFKESDFAGKNGRAWFVEDINTEELFPQQLAWIEENARQMANFDVPVRGRNFKMRVYLYDPTCNAKQGCP